MSTVKVYGIAGSLMLPLGGFLLTAGIGKPVIQFLGVALFMVGSSLIHRSTRLYNLQQGRSPDYIDPKAVKIKNIFYVLFTVIFILFLFKGSDIVKFFGYN